MCSGGGCPGPRLRNTDVYEIVIQFQSASIPTLSDLVCVSVDKCSRNSSKGS